MKFNKVCLFTIAAAMLLTPGLFAKNSNQGSMTVDQTLHIGNAQLKPGHYKVEWSNTGTANQVKVNILQRNKTVAEVPAKLIRHSTPSAYNDVVTTNTTKVPQLKEIDFYKRTQALVLEPNRAM